MGMYNKIAAVFSGQGSQYVGMGKDLYRNYTVAKEVFDKASAILGIDIISLITESNQEELNRTENAQIAVFVTSIAAFKVFEEECKVKPIVVAGHSLGEISALTVAGAFSFKDALLLVHDRAMYMKEACNNCSGTMYAIRNVLHSNIIELIKDEKDIWISNINSKNQVVISGKVDSVKKFVNEITAEGAIINELKVSGAFHSGLMKSASEKLKLRLNDITINEPRIPVISNVNARFEGKKDIADNLYRHLVMPVLWSQTTEKLIGLGVQAVIEFGAGHVLTNMINYDTSGAIDTFLFEKNEDIKSTILQINLCYEEKEINIFERCLAAAICKKNNNNDYADYENNVVKNIEFLRKNIEKNNISAEDIEDAIEALRIILMTKKLSNEEINETVIRVKRK